MSRVTLWSGRLVNPEPCGGAHQIQDRRCACRRIAQRLGAPVRRSPGHRMGHRPRKASDFCVAIFIVTCGLFGFILFGDTQHDTSSRVVRLGPVSVFVKVDKINHLFPLNVHDTVSDRESSPLSVLKTSQNGPRRVHPFCLDEKMIFSFLYTASAVLASSSAPSMRAQVSMCAPAARLAAQQLCGWVESQGGSASNVVIGPTKYGLGLLAGEDMKVGDAAVSIPQACIMSAATRDLSLIHI